MNIEEQHNEQAQRFEEFSKHVHVASTWLILLAVLSLVNSVITYLGSTVIAAFGLSATELADGVIGILPEMVEDYQWIFGGLAIGIYVTSLLSLLIGSQLGRLNKWIFIALAVLYLIDAGVAYWLEDYMGLFIHAIPMFMLLRGIYGHYKLDQLIDKGAGSQELRLGSLDLTPIKTPLTLLFWLMIAAWVVLVAATLFLLILF